MTKNVFHKIVTECGGSSHYCGKQRIMYVKNIEHSVLFQIMILPYWMDDVAWDIKLA
jgi:hypothetical protein